MKNIAKVWRSSTAFLLSAFSFLILITSCSNELDEALQPASNGTLQFVVSDFPTFGEGTQTRVIGTPDEGKTAWANEDKILVHLYSQKYGDQAATLTFDAGSNTWESDDASLSYLENETPTITAVYAPDCEIKDNTIVLSEGKKYGEAEYIPAKTTISGNTLDISFERGRIYSRLRIVAEAEQTLTVTTTGFTPAGPENVSAPDSYTLVADGKDNAYLYGTFAEGGSVTVKKGDAELATHTFSVTSEQGKSYALYAGKKVDVDLSTLAATYVINDDAYYTFTGTGSYGIKVESGNPRIVLNNASITVGEGSAIDIASGSNATIFVLGDDTIGTTKTEYSDVPCGGIFVAEGGTVILPQTGRIIFFVLTARSLQLLVESMSTTKKVIMPVTLTFRMSQYMHIRTTITLQLLVRQAKVPAEQSILQTQSYMPMVPVTNILLLPVSAALGIRLFGWMRSLL